MLRPIFALIGLLSLIACDVPTSEVCPTHYNYSPEYQDQAADELATLPEGSRVVEMIGHYGVVRAQIRACHNQ